MNMGFIRTEIFLVHLMFLSVIIKKLLPVPFFYAALYLNANITAICAFQTVILLEIKRYIS